MKPEEAVREAMREHVGRATPPVLDRSRLRREGRALRHRRTGTVLGAALSVAVVVAAAVQLGSGNTDGPDSDTAASSAVVRAPAGGLRAFTVYDTESEQTVLHIADSEVSGELLHDSDVTGATSPYGLFDIRHDGVPYLISPEGREIVLDGATDPGETGYDASIAADPQQPFVAWSSRTDAGVRLHLYGLDAGQEVATADVPCRSGDGCDLEVVALTGGVVFVRTSEGTAVWDPDRGDALAPFTDKSANVLDVGGYTLLLAGEPQRESPVDRPDSPLAGGQWQVVWAGGDLDAVSADGYWLLGHGRDATRTVSRVRGDGSPLLVDEVVDSVDADFDTDGSLLTVQNRGGGRYALIDCAYPSGDCPELWRSEIGHAPSLIGNDS
ncbi:MAG TPA: hypothetical protein VK365_09415 [Nocardioidaceae bacterium]|jgi:hypothetical protein|nr:hypothetical protein [Nocardioidaceae bacterium]